MTSSLHGVLVVALTAAAACSLRGPEGSSASTGTGIGGGQTTPAVQSNSVVTAASIGASSGGFVPMVPPSFTIEGHVVDQDGNPVPQAIVLQAGRSDEPTQLSSADGSFTLAMTYSGVGIPTVVATKLGYRTAGLEVYEVPDGAVELVLRAAEPPDNEAYVYGEPGKGKDPSTAFCGHCHDSIAAEFQTSGHARATREPLVQAIYAGTTFAHSNESACLAAGGRWLIGKVPGTASDTTSKCYVGGGVLPDLNLQCGGADEPACDDPSLPQAARPTAFGRCADCHSPGMYGKAGGRDLHDAVGIAYENGVHCDFCHKVADVDLAKPAGTGGRLKVQRPSETFSDGPPGGKLRQVMFGPLLDVPNPNMGGSLQPKFATAELCAGCHEHHQEALVPGTSLAERFADGLPVHTTYSEWLEGPYSKAGVHCQRCHMPANDKLDSAADLGNAETASITYGFPRPSEQIRRHTFQGPLVKQSPKSPRLIDAALAQTLGATIDGDELEVTVDVGNLGCGHAVPTGEPMRAVLLVLEASCDGTALSAIDGLTLDEVGGSRARGVVGGDLTLVGNTVTWSAAASTAKPGDVLRVVRATGSHHDYDGVGLFAGATLAAADKGMPILKPVGEAKVMSVSGDTLMLDGPLLAEPGDIAYLGDALATTEGQTSLALAGRPGLSFARVLVDAAGNLQVPHHRAIDMVRDNRIAPTKVQRSTYRFALAPSCSGKSALIETTLLYRPLPQSMAALRGVVALDHRIGTSALSVSIP